MKERLDQMLVERGLAESREKARALIPVGHLTGGTGWSRAKRLGNKANGLPRPAVGRDRPMVTTRQGTLGATLLIGAGG